MEKLFNENMTYNEAQTVLFSAVEEAVFKRDAIEQAINRRERAGEAQAK